MIKAEEFRIGNKVLYKNNGRISTVSLSLVHFEMIAKHGANDFFPVLLKAELLTQSGFIENKDYALYPQAHEYSLQLAIPGLNKNELKAWIKSNGECFARALVNDLAISANVFHLHSLQNLYYALTAEELTVK